MGFLDRLERGGAIDTVADANADTVDARTEGTHSGTIDKVAGAAKRGVDTVEERSQRTERR